MKLHPPKKNIYKYYYSSQIDWHQRMCGYEKVVQSQYDGQILHYVTVPCNQPAETEYYTEFSS